MGIFHLELRSRIAVGGHRLSRHGNTHPESLHVPQVLHRGGKVWVAVIARARSPEIGAGHLAVRATRVLDLDSIAEPVQPSGRIRVLVGAVEYGVTYNLLKRHQRVVGPL